MKLTPVLLSAFLLVFANYTPFFAQTCQINLGPDVTSCKNAPLRLNPNPASSDARYDWTSSPNANKLSCTDCPSPSVINLTTAGTYVFVARMICTDNTRTTDTIRVTVADPPLIIAASPAGVCTGKSATITAISSVEGTYKWSNGQSGASITVSPASITTYIATFTDNNGCAATAFQTITVYPVPANTSITASSGKSFCANRSITLTADGNNPYDPKSTHVFFQNRFIWNTGEVTRDIVVNNAAVGAVYTVTMISPLGCSTTASITAQPSPGNVSIAPIAQPICPESEFTLTARLDSNNNNIAGGRYSWSSTGTTLGNSLATSGVLAGTTHTYTVTYTIPNGCTSTATIDVRAKNITGSIIAPADVEYDVGDPIRFEGRATPSTTTPTWNFPDNNVSRQGTAFSYTPQIGNEPGPLVKFPYELEINAEGCKVIVKRTVNIVLPVVAVPNIFSPNGDGVNDQFRIVVKNKRKASIDRFLVFNRWGQKVFESTAPDANWDGKVNGGDEAPADVYVYRILWKRNDGLIQTPLSGEINLIR